MNIYQYKPKDFHLFISSAILRRASKIYSLKRGETLLEKDNETTKIVIVTYERMGWWGECGRNEERSILGMEQKQRSFTLLVSLKNCWIDFALGEIECTKRSNTSSKFLSISPSLHENYYHAVLYVDCFEIYSECV